MFTVAYFIGIYSYAIFALGILHLLTYVNIFFLTLVLVAALIFLKRRAAISTFHVLGQNKFISKKIYQKSEFWLFLLIILLALVNLLGALGPELSFDALWYHLTIPRFYLLHHSIFHIPGGLLYYSDMPKLGEMLYVGALSLGNEITAKVIHYFFGLLCCIALYKFSREFFTKFISWVIVAIFYSNLVVDTESLAAYIDLVRTFFEVLALWSFTEWIQKKQWKHFFIAASMVGLTITTKVLAISSLIIFSLLIIIIYFDKSFSSKIKLFSLKKIFAKAIVSLFIFVLIALFIPLPWFIFSFIHTGNPVYPFFTTTYEIHATNFGFIQFFVGLWNLFMYSPDPISPIYLIFLPLIFITYSTFKKEYKLIFWYSGLSLILWYFTPQTGGGRFILPYLPAFSFICGAIYSEILKKTGREMHFLSKILFTVIIFVSVISIGYRFIANSKYIPVLLGKESKSQFLSSHLNFSYGDFYDTDGYFASHIASSDNVLLYGFHNLYYIDFPFTDNSWVTRGDSFNYIATQKTQLPVRFRDWQLIYNNDKSMVQLYKPPKGECHRTCYF